jgi:esterase
VADMGMKRYPPHHNTIFEALLSADLDQLKTRKAVEEHVKGYIHDISVVQFLLKNLYWSDKEQLAWRMNLHVLHREIDEILAAVPPGTISAPTLFIRGGKSNYILEEDYETIRTQIPDVKFLTIENAGHWIHAEAPKEFFEAVMNFLD